MTYDDRILHLQRTIEIILKQNLLSAIHLAPLTFPTSSHQNPSPIVATAAPFSPRLDGFMPSRGYQIEAKACGSPGRSSPSSPLGALTVGLHSLRVPEFHTEGRTQRKPANTFQTHCEKK